MVNDERFVTVGVEQDDLDLATIAGIDQTGRVDDRHAVASGESRTWQGERRDPGRQAERDTGRYHGAFLRRYHEVDGRMKVEGGVAGVGAGGQPGLGSQASDRQVHLYPTPRPSPLSSLSASSSSVCSSSAGRSIRRAA